jgi:hypothetical protein
VLENKFPALQQDAAKIMLLEQGFPVLQARDITAQGGRVSEARSGTLGHRTRINLALQGRHSRLHPRFQRLKIISPV